MSESKYTPGPWKKEARINSLTINVVPHRIYGFKARVVGGGDGQMVAHAFGKTSAEAEANARLIAAAPEMLQKLHNCVSALTFAIAGMDESDPWITKLRATRDGAQAIIAKAEGQP
jgi:hypothetical protein